MLNYLVLSLFLVYVTIGYDMPKRPKAVRRRPKKAFQPLFWLPVDSRILPDIFAFGHVRGIARIFLEIEITLAILIVIGTLTIVILRTFFS
ncbi:hypothetical protein A2Z33_05340 [Candidatus Gottesmanbacteria bacterium RBG_16_52_11]|uniref:Uncharacterized protein n=1 Tax=Candidatus Gottesmanbacteria bacterium RBG_16_52_11 TaxID=1798374 RepID=A0A1F5YM86_9BACT|nr:MAG: hypothetical protein A2Z33_05340 [Candidatus Gottesmanbacteria bacterium RBG_16_52_11]